MAFGSKNSDNEDLNAEMVGEFLIHLGRMQGMSRERADQQAHEVLAEVEGKDWWTVKCAALSHGIGSRAMVDVLLAHPAHQEHLVVGREAEQDGEGNGRHEALDRAGAVEPDEAEAVPLLDDEREHAEANKR